MATIQFDAAMPGHKCLTAAWEGLSTGDTASPLTIDGTMGAIGSVQVTGTFGGATVVLQVSNDGTNWVTIKSLLGLDVSLTAAGLVEFSTGALFLRPAISGGTGDDVDVTVVLRG